MAACPYDAIFINPEDHSAEKCNFCAHRIEVGLEPACVVVCPVEAILVGDLNDPTSKVATLVSRERLDVRRPEKDTRPKLFYRGASRFTLDPLAATRPPGGIYAWAQQAPDSPHVLNAGVQERSGRSQASAIVSYDVAHAVPWDWRVGLYTWTKSIAAGVYLVAALLVLFGSLGVESALWRWWVPLASLALLAATGGLLIWDLEHPSRFYFIFTRPQWRSWLVRGGVVIAGFGACLVVHLGGSVADVDAISKVAMVVAVPLSLLTAVYTAFLFAQAKARDLWQNPLLPPHLAVQAVLAGAGVLALLAPFATDAVADEVVWVLFAAAAVHLAMVAGEVLLPHATAHSRLAVHHLVSGRIGGWFWGGTALIALALVAPAVPALGGAAALAGLAAYEHAYVQAGQSVPLA